MTSELALKTDIKVIGVVGGGTMGHGISQVALQSGLQVLLHDLEEAILKRARERIAAGLAKGGRRGRVGGDGKHEKLQGVLLHDLEEAILKRARERIAAGLAKGVRRGRFGEDEKQEMLKGLVLTITPLGLSAALSVIAGV